jgi:acetyl-CoA carboxylase biotin carboxyl carrier protein
MPKLEIDETMIRKLAHLLEETGLTELEYEAGQQRIRVTRAHSNSVAAASPAGAPAASSAPAAPADDALPEGAILSPMVGTAYIAPEPGAEPFIAVGAKVTKGQTLLVIEAMKVMNPLPAPKAGTVTQVMVSDGMPVEYGQLLLVLE